MDGLDVLFDAAKAAQARAYAPYSRFPVGAALRTPGGAIFSGCNVENAAYPLGLCAEASAIAAMIGAGETKIADILVLGPGPERITPCGACRQRIAEFATPATVVHLADGTGAVESLRLGDLLPRAFGPASLKNR
jgi:cytidine deaminase